MGNNSAKPGLSANNSSKKPKKRRSARPRLIGERLDVLLDVAADVFIAEGFQAASTNEIARRAGASKLSLYSRFPKKEDLFLAVLERRMNRIFHEVSSAIPEAAPLEKVLWAFGMGILSSALSEAQIALMRVVSMETVRFPQLGQRFFELGPGRGIAALATYLEGQINNGVLRREDSRVMAQNYLGLVAGPPLFFSLLGVREHLKTNKQRAVHLEQAIKVFERAYALR